MGDFCVDLLTNGVGVRRQQTEKRIMSKIYYMCVYIQVIPVKWTTINNETYTAAADRAAARGVRRNIIINGWPLGSISGYSRATGLVKYDNTPI